MQNTCDSSRQISLPSRTVVNTYEVATFKKRNTVHFPSEVPTKVVAAMSFTADSKGMAILSREPDSYILLVFFDKLQTQVLGRVSHSTNQSTIARCLSCCPGSSGMIALGGNFTFKLLNKTEKGFAPLGSIKGDGLTITSMAWLTNDIMIAGTSEADLFIVENGDLKLLYNALDVLSVDLAKIQASDDGEEGKKEMQSLLAERRKSSTLSDRSKSGALSVMCLVTLQRSGFCFALGNTVQVFQRAGSVYKKTTIITIPITLYEADLYRIKTIAINQTEDRCLVTCHHSQIYQSALFVAESVTVDCLQFGTLGQPLHIAAIIGLSVCAWKPIVVTASRDQTIRIWNYDTGTVELVKKYLVDISVIAAHPSGLFVAVGFCDQLRIMEILLDNLKV